MLFDLTSPLSILYHLSTLGTIVLSWLAYEELDYMQEEANTLLIPCD